MKQDDSKNDQQICLYRRISNEDEQKQYQRKFKQVDERVIHSFLSSEDDDESSLNSDFKQSSILSLTFDQTSSEENDYDTSFKLEISLTDECATYTMHQSPSEATIVLDIIPACMLMFINCTTRAPIRQLPSLPTIILEIDATRLWQHKSLLNIRLIDNTTSIQDHQSLKLV